MARDTHDVVDWAGGGGGWEPPPDPTPPPPDPRRDEPKRDDGNKPNQPEPKRDAHGQLGGVGLVCGRFLPLHNGHHYVIDVARGCVEDLRVIVFASPADPISGTTRVRWIRDSFPGITVELYERTSNAPATSAELLHAIRRGPAPRMLFGSEAAYTQAAHEISATFVPVDPSRAMFPISGTAIRADVLGHYDTLPAVVRPWFVRRVAIIGAEGVGKTTLSTRLAEHYRTHVVPEYARTLGDFRRVYIQPDALSLAARGQIATEDALASSAHRVLICDTNAQTMAAWHRRLFDVVPAWLGEAAAKRPYDLVLAPWYDGPRAGDPVRRAFHDALLDAHANAVRLPDNLTAAFDQACDAIDAMLSRPGFLAARARYL